MTNEEVYARAHEEFALRGMSIRTENGYLCTLRIFLRYYENCPIETMSEPEIREFLLNVRTVDTLACLEPDFLRRRRRIA